MLTSDPEASASSMAARVASSTRPAAAPDTPARSATWPVSSDLFTVNSLPSADDPTHILNVAPDGATRARSGRLPAICPRVRLVRLVEDRAKARAVAEAAQLDAPSSSRATGSRSLARTLTSASHLPGFDPR